MSALSESIGTLKHIAFYGDMPTFYTHIDNGTGYQRDEVGADFPDLNAARESAITGGLLILADEINSGAETARMMIYLEDDRHVTLAVIPILTNVGRG